MFKSTCGVECFVSLTQNTLEFGSLENTETLSSGAGSIHRCALGCKVVLLKTGGSHCRFFSSTNLVACSFTYCWCYLLLFLDYMIYVYVVLFWIKMQSDILNNLVSPFPYENFLSPGYHGPSVHALTSEQASMLKTTGSSAGNLCVKGMPLFFTGKNCMPRCSMYDIYLHLP